ncbi:hypothetical protein N9B83_00790 [Schleiferiaceae bacterium]|nr:hypothetical protein [Schleiferiaceae bacterium]
MDQEFQFLVNYRLLAKQGGSLFWFMPYDLFGYEDLVEIIKSCPSHSLTVVTYYDGVRPLLELVEPHVKQLSWIKLNLTSMEFRYRACLISDTHFAPNSFEVGIEPWDEEVYEYFEWLEAQALSELAEITNWSKAA